MTAQAETRFCCDRCHSEEYIATENTPVNQRVPHGWLAMTVTERPHTHLCADCSRDFTLFMDAPEATAAREEHKIEHA